MSKKTLKIVYAIQNRVGAALILKDFLEGNPHEVKIAAYPSAFPIFQHFTWNLSVLSNLQIKNAKTKLNNLRQDFIDYSPDLLICDAEPITAKLAQELSIPIIYCSPLYLLEGLPTKLVESNYCDTLDKAKTILNSLPEGVAKFIYAPFSKVLPDLKEGYEWVSPSWNEIPSVKNTFVGVVMEDLNRFFSISELFLKENNDWIYTYRNDPSYKEQLAKSHIILSDGNISNVSDVLFNDKQIICIPNPEDPEQVLTAIFCKRYDLGPDLGKVENLSVFALKAIERQLKALESKTSFPYFKWQVQTNKTLLQRIEELWECM